MNRILFLLLSMSSLLFTTGCCENHLKLRVYDLSCENLTDPLGIGSSNPRLSWKFETSADGESLSAYQILAASSPDLLTENKADLWNSGKTESPESILISWNGEELPSGSVCYWKVRIWDNSGRRSGWSETAYFTTGLLENSEWKGDYIGISDSSEFCVSPLLKRDFTIDKLSGSYYLHVNSLGYHEVWINGAKVGEYVLSPAVSQFNKRSLALTYDITDLLRKGSNELILWIGQGWYSKGLPGVQWTGPLVRAQLEKINGRDRELVLVTDSEWTARASGYSTIGTWRPHQFGGELVEGAMLTDYPGEGNRPWIPVSTVPLTEVKVSPQMTEANRIMDTVRAVSIGRINDSTWLADMGTTLTGWLRINFSSLKPGQKIEIRYSDHLDKYGKTVNQGQIDRYIAAGTAREQFMNKFNYHGFRYAMITGLTKAPAIEDITAFLIHTGYTKASTFECSDEDLNSIYNMINYTLRCLSLGGYLVDCPQIERLGYGGDGNASTITAQSMFNLAPLYSNWLQAWEDCIRDDGSMPHTAPNPYSAGGGPYWCGFIITASWNSYLNYGDEEFLKRYYPAMQRWLGYAEKYSPEGLLEGWPETEYRSWYLGDWAVPEGINQTDPESIGLVNNCFMTVCYETMKRIATVLGRDEDSRKYAEREMELLSLINQRFYNNKNRIYGSGSQIDLAYPLLAGIVPDSLVSAVRQKLIDFTMNERGGHFACGLVGIPVITEWATLSHEAELMYSMLKKRDYPGYLYMTDNGATTTWEHWNGARSRIHNCYNGIGSWFIQALGGIRPDPSHPGYRKFIIDPQVPDGVNWANTSKETPYGTVVLNWKIENGSMQLDLKVPAGSNAILRIPRDCESWSVNGVDYSAASSETELDNGSYIIVFKLYRQSI